MCVPGMEFSGWLENELKKNGYDSDVCTSYLMSLLESHEEIYEWLQEMGDQLDDFGIQQFHDQIYEYFHHPERIPQRGDELNDQQGDDNLGTEQGIDEVSDLQETTAEPVEIVKETIELESFTAPIDDNIEDEEDLTPDMDNETIDYVSLAQDLEWYLSNTTPIVIFSTEAIMESLYCTNGIIFDAFNLLQSNYQLCGSPSSDSQSRPCRHLVQSGKCLRSDCIFDHYFASKTCKFWLTTGCLSAECLFLHQLVFPEHNSASYPQLSAPAAAILPTNSIFDFPELISQTKKIQSNIVPKHNSFSSPSASVSYKSALGTIAPTNSQSLSGSENSLRKTQPQQRGVGSISSGSISRNLWVESGESVCSNYKEQREDARTLAIARNKLLEEATQAYLRGAKDIAKRLAREGQELNKQMKESHYQAAMSIFRKRNSPKSVFSDYRVDLHGLHVQEARECVISVLAEISVSLSSHSSFPKVTIITGTGHHTNGPQKGVARVLKAVEALCEECGLSYVYIKDPRGFVGGVLVQLRADVIW